MLARAASSRITLPLICLAAFALRVVCGLFAPDHFWAYAAYFHVADSLVHGGGYCWEPGRLCAFFPPVYPTVGAAAILTGHMQAGAIELGSLAGAGTVWMTARMGALLFSPLVGMLAAGYAAIYPYFVWHDGVLQENAALAFSVALCVWLLLRAARSNSRGLWFAAGMALALTVLTKANLALFVPFALFWLGRRRWFYAAHGVVALLGPWVVRTWLVTGAPILYSNGGFSLWTANQQKTNEKKPEQSIDAAQEPEWLDVPVAERHAFYEIHDPQFIRETAWFWKRGMAFMEAHPWLTSGRAVRKVWLAFSPVFSPRHGAVFEAVYLVSYLPLFVLAPFGMWRSRDRWRDFGCIYWLIASFAVSCALFWGHTSHRMYIEPYLMNFAAACAGRKPGGSAQAVPWSY